MATVIPAAPPDNATPFEAIRYAKAAAALIVDFRFTDLPGQWQHFSVPVKELTESLFGEGIGFDGSSIRGFQQIHESDMLLMPDPGACFMDPCLKVPTLVVICDVVEPGSYKPYSRDPRQVGHKAERFLKESGLADTAYFGPELEFYIFGSLAFDQAGHRAMYEIDSPEGIWNSGANGGPNRAHRPRPKEGYFPVPPLDQYQDLRSEMIGKMAAVGIDIEVHHHEVGGPGQAEIDMRFDTLVAMADKVLKYKYIVKSTAAAAGAVATFMPKPLFGDNGSGMHTHQSLWRDGTNLFYDKDSEYALISDTCRWYIGGLLKHAKSILGIAAPTTNSYRRLVPGYEAPINLVYSQRNRSACIRIPTYSDSPAARRIEFRSPDPACNPYLSFAAQLMAGIDGVINRIEPPAPVDQDIYEMSAEERRCIAGTPGTLEEALDCLESDQEYLYRGGVFTPDVIEAHLEFRRAQAKQVSLRPVPYEFYLYSEA
ncbi:MAG: type I glutamate--ammonia ligase [Candidatus Limnocylindrales bacterium]|jgi:glutamine synthetase